MRWWWSGQAQHTVRCTAARPGGAARTGFFDGTGMVQEGSHSTAPTLPGRSSSAGAGAARAPVA
eukprot:6195696-Pleurochrysis_carterae.AAC.2